jgi:hypothetical protein
LIEDLDGKTGSKSIAAANPKPSRGTVETLDKIIKA